MDNLQMMNAREVGKILGVNANIIYKLWNSGRLDYWCLNGGKKTNLNAIASFLERTRNIDLTEQMK